MKTIVLEKNIKELIELALREDIGDIGDITSNALIPPDQVSTFNLISNENAIISGTEVFIETFKIIDSKINVLLKYKDGDEIKKGSIVSTLSGNTRAILKGERVGLNFISHLSGIATCTNKLVKLIKHTNVKLLDTRKTTPGFRGLEKKAIKDGGGFNHRENLSEMILIKDNHIANAGGVKKSIEKARVWSIEHGRESKIEIEVNVLSELKEAIEAKPDRIMLDNWDIEDIKKAIKEIPKEIKIELSGNINPDTILSYANCLPDYISTSYMVKNAHWIDFSLEAL